MLIQVDVFTSPGVVNGDIVPVMIPLHLEKSKASIVIQFHAIGFYHCMYVVAFGPGR